MNASTMKRRDFINRAVMASAGAGLISVMPRKLLAQSCQVTDLSRTLVNVMLQGGADLRFLFMPSPAHPDSEVLNGIWDARRALYDPAYDSYQQMFDNEYLLTTDPLSGLQFGIFKRSAWLQSEFEAGRVAVVANAFCSRNRRHDQSILNADAGEPELAQLNFDRAGWGGRLAEQLTGQSNVVELGQSVSVFCKGTTPGARLDKVVHAEDMRNIALAGESPDVPSNGRRNVLARALGSWYETRSEEVAMEQAPGWPYHTFFKHHKALDAFGSAIEQKLSQCQPIPKALADLALNKPDFAQQCRNLYDACQLPDVLGARVLSMGYGGWDTHDDEYNEIGDNLEDLFGAEGGFATALPLIEALPYLEQPQRDKLVFYFASDFGRQLLANGTGGTDHGRGTYSILTGSSVRGGIYGELFPQAEAQPGPDGHVPLEEQGADITGLTSTEKILANACEWCEPGSSPAVFPQAGAAAIETPGMLDELFYS